MVFVFIESSASTMGAITDPQRLGNDENRVVLSDFRGNRQATPNIRPDFLLVPPQGERLSSAAGIPHV